MSLRIICAISVLLSIIGGVRADEPFGVEFRYVNVMPGQTLGELVSRLYPDAGDPQRVISAIVRLNPQAFVGQDPDRMKSGAKLVLPRSIDLDNARRSAAGKVTHSEGQAEAIDLLGRSRRLEAGATIYTGDLLQTAVDSRLHMRMDDGAHFYLRPCSEFRIVDYHYTAGESGSSRLLLLRGGVATATGKIGREFRQNYALGTPLATIGVRGTEYAVQFCADRQCAPCAEPDASAPRAELHVGVTAGAVEVNLPREQIEVGSDRYLLAAGDDRPSVFADRDPRLLLQSIRAEPAAAIAVDSKQEAEGRNWIWWLIGALLLAVAL